ncbi:MAG: hypothetical protein LBD13_03805 [Spirochaetaceae bacterium]|nr:hypothetical protein [Spirochaetaceae bacterium]
MVLYAKEAVDLDAIRSRFARAGGAFPERVAKAVGADYIPADQARYEPDSMRFSAQSPNPKAVSGLLLAIDHR